MGVDDRAPLVPAEDIPDAGWVISILKIREVQQW